MSAFSANDIDLIHAQWAAVQFPFLRPDGAVDQPQLLQRRLRRAQAQLAEAQALHQALRLDGAVVSQQAEVEQRRVPVAPAKQPVDLIGAQDDALFAVPQNISGHDAAPFPFRFNPLAFYFTRNPPRRKAAARVFSENSAFRQKVLFPAEFCAIINLYSYLQSHAPRRVAVRK